MTSDLEFHVYFIACVWLALVLYYSQYFSVKSTYKMYLDSRQETCLHHLRAHRVRNLKIITPPRPNVKVGKRISKAAEQRQPEQMGGQKKGPSNG